MATEISGQSIIIRDARAEDKPAIIAFTQHTWSWGDYLPDVIDRWLADTSGRLLVAETEQGQIIGTQHYQRLNGTQCWLSGLRVHPDYRRHGLAIRFLDDAIVMARRELMHVLRYAAEVTNDAIHHLSEERSLHPRGTWLVFDRNVDALGCMMERTKPTMSEEARTVRPGDKLRVGSLLHSLGRSLYVQSWTWRALDQVAISSLISQHRGFVAQSRMGGWSVALLGAQTEHAFEVTLYGPDAPSALALLEFLHRMACVSADGVTITVHVPQDTPAANLLANLARRGEWRRVTEHPLRIWELDLIRKNSQPAKASDRP